MTDYLIRNATVVDGSADPRYVADVAVHEGAIGAITPRPNTASDPEGAVEIDADGLVLSPGFIDMHAHSDLQVLADPPHMGRINQGITTEVTGQDGLSFAPVSDETLAELRVKIAGWNGNPPDFDFSWRTVAQYLDRLDQGVATNQCYLAPHGSIRALAAGWSDDPLTESQLDRMCDILAQCLDQGAAGMSSGLGYTPAMYAGAHELERLCTVVADKGGFFCPHIRSYGKGALDAYREVLSAAKNTGCRIQLTHTQLVAPLNAWKGRELLDIIDDAIDDGVDVALDSYPYDAGATTLVATLPGWCSAGGMDHTMQLLKDPEALGRIRQAMETDGSDGLQGITADWDKLEISGVGDPELERYGGMTLAELAETRHQDPFEAYIWLLLRDRLGTTVIEREGLEENIRTIMQHPRHLVCSDGILAGKKIHPRAWGTCTKYLAEYRRNLGLFSLEQIVAQLSGSAATRLRLRDRGYIRTGYAADLVIFDPATVAPGSTFDQPRKPSTGIDYVFVNGQIALDHGTRTPALAGRALRAHDNSTWIG